MKVLELYAGTQSIGKEFRKAGHEVVSVEIQDLKYFGDYAYDEGFDPCYLQLDILEIVVADFVKQYGYFDIVWLSPMCTTHSIAAISKHRTKLVNGYLVPKSDKAFLHDKIFKKALQLTHAVKPSLWFIENPRGGMRKAEIMKDYPRYTVTYCQYGDKRMKPTDIWTNHPNPKFKPMCKNGDPCHEPAPRGSSTGTQGLKNNMLRSIIPKELCEHIVKICEEE